MNIFQRFQHPKFGHVRIIDEDGKILFCGRDVTKALKIGKPDAAVLTCAHSDGTVFLACCGTRIALELPCVACELCAAGCTYANYRSPRHRIPFCRDLPPGSALSCYQMQFCRSMVSSTSLIFSGFLYVCLTGASR